MGSGLVYTGPAQKMIAPGKSVEAAMKRTMLILAASFTVGSAALANQSWKDKDANGDGQISKAEHDAAVTAAWTKKDADANGQLSMAEAGMKAGADWTAADTNGDGQLSSAEFMAKKSAWFTKADANGDGAISKTEHDAATARKKR